VFSKIKNDILPLFSSIKCDVTALFTHYL
jgi:hypothetical protein